MTQTQLYIISPEKIRLDSFAEKLKSALSAGEVGAFQLRLKNIPDDKIIAAGKKLLPICDKYGVQFILNDRPDLAAKIGANGVHIGEEQDGTYENARKIMGDGKIVGVSCYGSVDRAMDFASQGADYVAFGAFYPTKTKKPKARPKPDILEWWVRNSTIPCVAIGGIKPDNCAPLIEAGADFIAVVSAIWDHPKGPKVAVEEFLTVMK